MNQKIDKEITAQDIEQIIHIGKQISKLQILKRLLCCFKTQKEENNR